MWIGYIEMILLRLIAMSCIFKVGGNQLDEGRWELLLENAGVSAMHMTLTHANTVLIFDQTLAGPSQIMRNDSACSAATAQVDCWAHSVEYDIAGNKVRPLHLLTDTFCSSGSFDSNGSLVQTGGWSNGDRVIRRFHPCSDATCDWIESPTPLSARRWYASNQILPLDDRVIVVGGRRSFSYEFVPKTAAGEGAFQLPFLVKTNTVGEENNLYPFLHLSSDGNLFIFANRDSILFDSKKNEVVKSFPTIPGGGARNYPSSGSSVMLPLDFSNDFQKVEILVCGGAPDGAYKAALNGTFVEALKSCGRIEITAPNPKWQMEDMPGPRVMGDMLILPTGEILIINGGKQGTAGWQSAREPALSPFIYRATQTIGNRFRVLAPTTIPRMYHSTANVLPDGRVLVAGSNSNFGYRFSGVPFPTELRVEAYIPYYLDPSYDSNRVIITSISTTHIKYGSKFNVRFTLSRRPSDENIQFQAYAPPFTTHTWSMNQRMLSLAAPGGIWKETVEYSVSLIAPPGAVAAPSGYYLLSIVNGGVPSKAEWIRFLN